MEPYQILNLVQMLGYTLGTIDSMQKRCEPGSKEHMDLEEISDQLIDASKYIKHTVLCTCDELHEHEELDDEL